VTGLSPDVVVGHASSDGLLAEHTVDAVVEPRADDNVEDKADGSEDVDIVSPVTKRKLCGKAGIGPVPVDNG
jgi:hypothetical protein